MRVCLDAWKLNQILVPRHDVPTKIEEVIRKFRGKCWLTSTDVTSGYFNVRLEKNSRKYTAFSVEGIQYCYRVLPFGLRVSGQTFIKCLEKSLSEETKINSAIYVDDVVVGSDEHMRHLRSLFRDVREASIKLNFDKTKVARREVEFVSHMISAEGIKPIEDKLQSIHNFERPQNVKQLRKFIGLVSFYRKFVRNFSSLLCPLN